MYYSLPLEDVRQSWESMKPGERKVTDDGHGIVRLKKMVLVVPCLSEAFGGVRAELPHELRIIAFPKPDHFETFKVASRGVRRTGPAELNQAGIGTLRLIRSKGRRMVIDFAQAHFRTRDSHSLPRNVLPRGLATHYGGWRKHALREALRIAKEHKFSIAVRRYESFLASARITSPQFVKEVEDVARETNAVVTDTKDELTVNPNPSIIARVVSAFRRRKTKDSQ